MSNKDIYVGLSTSDSGNEQGFKRLAFPFTKRGFTHELIKRDGLVCLVKRTRVGYSEIAPHFEVVKLQLHREWIAQDGRVVPACESYPHSELWGERGFTYRTLDEALVKHRQMVQGTGSSAVSSAGSVNTLPVLKTSRGAQMQLELEAA